MHPSPRDEDVLIDSQLAGTGYVESFGFEWTSIDGFKNKEVMSHGHLFGRFLLPPDFFVGKRVADIGCGNGRMGRLIARDCKSYCGIDLSDAVYAFPKYIERPEEFTLAQASATDLPLDNYWADISICWGVMHHTDDPKRTFDELLRITKPGGTILVFVYPKSFDTRKNLNTFIHGIPEDKKFGIVQALSDQLDSWREVDAFYAKILGQYMALSVKQSREWQIFQWFDGITPQYHWSIEEEVSAWAAEHAASCANASPGCFAITTKAGST